jgi:hypothetical protein
MNLSVFVMALYAVKPDPEFLDVIERDPPAIGKERWKRIRGFYNHDILRSDAVNFAY